MRDAVAAVTVNNSKIVSSGAVSIGANATAESPVEALTVKDNRKSGFAFGFASAGATATTSITGTTQIIASGNVSISSDATSKATVVARTTASKDNNKQKFGIVVGIASTDLDSQVNVGVGTTISSQLGNVSVDAHGEVLNSPEAKTGLYKDGTGGVTIALSFDDTNVNATVDGTVTAKGRDDRTPFNPNVNGVLNVSANTITLPNHGLKTGEVITYESNGGTAIPGLTSGDQYVVLVADSNTIQLAKKGHIDLRANDVNPASTHALSLEDVKTFSPLDSGAINVDSNRIRIPNHGFTAGQRVTYQAAVDSAPISGLTSGETYLVDSPNTDDFRLKSLQTNLIVDLTSTSNGEQPLTADHAFLFERPSKTFNPVSAVNLERNTITIPNHGLTSGDSVIYRTDATKPHLIGTIESADIAIDGLKNGGTYFVSVVDANTVRLSDTQDDSLNSAAIDLSTPSVGSIGTNQTISTSAVNGIGVTASLDAKNFARATTNVGIETGALDKGLNSEILTTSGSEYLMGKIQSKFSVDSLAKNKGPVASSSSGDSSKFTGAASFAINKFEHDAQAVVGANADLKSETNVVVDATIDQKVVTLAEGAGARKPGKGGVVIAGAAAVGLFDNDARATVQPLAHVNAKNNIDVQSTVSWPAPANFGTPAMIKEDPQAALSLLISDGPMISGNFSVTMAKSSADGDGTLTIGGSVAVTDIQNHSEAVIGQGALINQDVAYQTTSQKVNVDAQTLMTLVDVAGGSSGGASPESTSSAPSGQSGGGLLQTAQRKLKAWKNSSRSASSNSKGGIGGAVLVTFFDNTTLARIEDDATVRTGTSGGLNVTALEDVRHVGLAHAGSDAGTFGLSGSVTILDQDSVTHAQLASGVIITGGPLDLHASSDAVHISATGAIASGNGVGIGASVSITDITRDTAAFIGAANGLAAGTAGTSINASNVTVHADSDGGLYGFAIAAAKISDKKSTGGDISGAETDTASSTSSASSNSSSRGAGSNDAGAQGKYGVGISGSVALNTLNDKTLAFINDTGTVTSSSAVTITATNDTNVIAGSGGAALNTNAKGGAGIAGAWSQTDLTGTTAAYVTGATLVATKLDIEAKRDGDITAIAAGLAGVPRGKGFALAGSVAISNITDSTTATVNNATLTISGNVEIDATNSADILSVGGAVGYGSKGGIGAGVSINNINATTNAQLNGSKFSLTGGLDVRSTANGDILSVAGAIGASQGYVGGAGSVAVNQIVSNTDASIRNSQPSSGAATTTGAINVSSLNENYILTVAGAIGAAKNVGIGAAVAYSSIGGATTAVVDNSKLTTSSTVSVIAGAEPLIDSFAIGVGGGKSAGLAGSATVNILTNTVDAHVSGGSTISGSAVTISASDGAAPGFNPQGGSGNAVDFSSSHGLSTGDAFVYTAKNGKAIGGLEDGKTYYAIVDSSTRIRFASSKDNATSGTAITLDRTQAEGSLHFIGRSGIRSLAGGIAGAQSAAIGAGIAYNDIGQSFTSYIDGSTITATTGAVTVSSNTNAVIQSLAIGGAGAQTFALGGSVSINSVTNTVDAKISGSANVTGKSLAVSASNSATLQVLAGGFAGSGNAAIGAAVGINEITNTTTASSTASTLNSGTGSIRIDAVNDEDVLAITAAGAGAGTFALGGSVSLVQLSNTTKAFTSGGTLTAGDSVRVSATDDDAILNIGGGVVGAGSDAVGVGAASVTTNNLTEAFVGASTTINALGNGSGFAVRDGLLDSNGNPTTVTVRGLSVAAMASEDILSIAAGVAGGGDSGIAGSASVNVLNQTTKAHIDTLASINATNSGASTSQEVRVAAADLTKIIGVGGAIGGGGNVGIGAGVDLALITKTTEAYVAQKANIASNGNVVVDARSNEDITSVSASIGAAGTVGIAGSASVSVFTITTRAYVEGTATAANGAVINAQGNVLVNANETSDLDIISGNLAGGGVASLGAAGAVPVITKTTDAFIGQNATVNAKANRGTSNVFTGEFNVSYVTDTASEAAPRSSGGGRLSGTNLEVGARGGSKDLSQDGSNDVNDPSMSKQRVATPATEAISGVSVAAVNRDNIETVGISGGGSGFFAVNIGGAVNVLTVTTRAHVDPGAKVNTDQTGAAAGQRMAVAAGNDLYNMTIAGSIGLSGGVAAAASAAVTIATLNTSAFIDDGADVRALGDVTVVARGQEDLLAIAAGVGAGGVAVAGSGTVDVLNSTTKAYIGENALNDAGASVDGTGANGAKVIAGGNVLVLAKDTTDLDVIAGSAGIGIGSVGIGLSGAVSVLNKTTQGFIGDHASVDGNANGGSITVLSGSNAEATHTTTMRGVAVQAFSIENVLSVGAAGGVGLGVGAAAGVGVQIVDSNTTASVGIGADVNQNASGASAAQS